MFARKILIDVARVRGWFVVVYATVFLMTGCLEIVARWGLWCLDLEKNELCNDARTLLNYVMISGLFNSITIIPAIVISICNMMRRRERSDVETGMFDGRERTSLMERCLSMYLICAIFLLFDSIMLLFWNDMIDQCSGRFRTITNVVLFAVVLDTVARTLYLVSIPILYATLSTARFLGW